MTLASTPFSSSRTCCARRTGPAAGFTLLEILMAVLITSVVALIAYGTAQAGIDTHERLNEYRTELEAEAIVRALLVDALRHPPESGGAFIDDVLFWLDDAVDAQGVPDDAMHFLSRGVTPPLGATGLWSVSLEPTEQGVRLVASPFDSALAVPLVAYLPRARGLNVRVLARASDAEWSDAWDRPGRVPAAVSISFFSARGTPVGPALVVHAALNGVP